MYNNNNLSYRSRTPRTPGMTFHVQIVGKYQSLTIVNYSHSRGYRTRRSTSKSNSHKNTHLIGNLHVADSLEVSFTKLARTVFRNPVFDLWLKMLKGLKLRSLGKLFQALAPKKDTIKTPHLIAPTKDAIKMPHPTQ